MSSVLLPLGALVAGLLSFSSPCCLPLLPGYLSYMSALPIADLGAADARRVALRAALGFVLGFTVVFTLLGIGVAFIGAPLSRGQTTAIRVFGLGIVVLGLATLGVLRLPFLSRERRLDLTRVPTGPAWSVPMGMAFAAGWTPCVGPILATILAAASISGTAWWGGLLLVLYSIGLGVPFVLVAVGFSRAHRSLGWLRRHGQLLERLGGVMLVVVGVLFATGRWQALFRPMQTWFARYGWPPV